MSPILRKRIFVFRKTYDIHYMSLKPGKFVAGNKKKVFFDAGPQTAL